MANYYVKRTDIDGNNPLYMASDGTSWVANSASGFVTTTQAIADAIAAILNLLQLEIAAFYSFSGPPPAIYSITEVTI